jgi:hypothetical protein
MRSRSSNKLLLLLVAVVAVCGGSVVERGSDRERESRSESQCTTTSTTSGGGSLDDVDGVGPPPFQGTNRRHFALCLAVWRGLLRAVTRCYGYALLSTVPTHSALCASTPPVDNIGVRQVRLALGRGEDSMTVAWAAAGAP